MKKLINYNNLKDIANKLVNEESVAVICHIRPDGDAIGSAVALYLGLNGLGIKTDVVCCDVIPEKFNFLSQVKDFKRELGGSYSALVAVDCADITRLGGLAQEFFNHKNTYNIDHHISNNRYAKYNYIVENASNSENILQLLKSMEVEITKQIADFLLMGIMTDTGGFKHKNVTTSTLESAGELVGLGGDNNKIYYNCFVHQSKNRVALFTKVMGKIRYFLDERFAVITIMTQDLEESGAKADETEGFIDFVMGIEGVEVGASVMQMEKNKYKISFRAVETDVNAVASLFGGGGHTLASGCQISGDYEEIIDKIRYAVKMYIKD